MDETTYLWLARGYALHLGLSPSCTDPPSLACLENRPAADIHEQGLLDLVRLFVAFDQISIHRKSRAGIKSATDLTDAELKLSSLCLKIADCISTRTADCHITRQWMRTILWQEALSLGLLSSSSQTAVMTFAFPAQVGRDLLHSLRYFSDTDLLPLGRDQVSPAKYMARNAVSLTDCIVVEMFRGRKFFGRHRAPCLGLVAHWLRVRASGLFACIISEIDPISGARCRAQFHSSDQNG